MYFRCNVTDNHCVPCILLLMTKGLLLVNYSVYLSAYQRIIVLVSMELHELCCFLTQGRELPSFWSSTMEVHSFTNLKLQSAFPAVWLSFFDKAVLTPHFVQPTYIVNIKNLLKTAFCINFWHGWNLYFEVRIIYIVYLGGLLHKSQPWAVWLSHIFFAKPSKLAKILVMTL